MAIHGCRGSVGNLVMEMRRREKQLDRELWQYPLQDPPVSATGGIRLRPLPHAASMGANHPEETAMQIIDAQVHIWGSGTPSAHHRQVSAFTAEELIAEMDAAGVDGAVMHPPSWDPGSNELAVEAARKYPAKFCILGWFPLDKPESHALVDTWKQRPGMLGLRWALMRPEQQTWHEDGTMDWVWPAAERAGVPVATAGGPLPAGVPAHRRSASQLAAADRSSGAGARGQGCSGVCQSGELLPLAKLPNVAIKATGAPGYSSGPYPFRGVHDGLHRIFDAYGPHRFFWGTDITRMPCSYRQCVTMFTEELAWLKGRDLELVMGQGVKDWLGWKA